MSQNQLAVLATTSVQSNCDPQEPLTTNCSISITGVKKCRATALETCVLTATNRQSKHRPIHERQVAFLLDSGAQRSVITSDMVETMQFPIIGKERIALQGFNEKSPRSLEYKVVQVTVGKGSKHSITFDALVIKNINEFVLTGAAAFAKKIARVATLADPRFLNTKSDEIHVDVLLANDHRWKVLCPRSLPKQLYGMFLPKTVFGDLVLSGKIPGSDISSVAGTNVVTLFNISSALPILENNETILEPNLVELSNILNNLDNLGITVGNIQDEEIGALENFKANVSRDPTTNAYVVGFPWINGTPPVPGEIDTNEQLVRSRFNQTMKGLDRKPETLHEYAKVHEQEYENEFIEPIDEKELKNSSIFRHFITHFPVIKDTEGCTTKVRRVYDASLHAKGRPCLNDLMSKGCQLTPHILKILLILRLTPFLFCSDISKAFLRMYLQPRDRNYTCFFVRDNWSDPKSPISIWRFKSVLFGATSSPFLLNCSISDIIQKNDFDHHMEVFVDNLFILLCKEEQILQAADQICTIFGKNAFPLHELASNNIAANLEFTSKGLAPATPEVKTLGLFWHTDSDSWRINKPNFTIDKASKRSILSDLAKVFDPLGFYAILTVQGRLILQETYESIWKWDGALPQCILTKWSDLVSSLSLALNSPVPRWVGTDIQAKGTISVHCFTDASDRALGCVIYLVQRDLSRFYTAKPKLCPTKFAHYSIPRKELTAISIGIRYLRFVINSISKYIIPSSVHLWSDSTTALTWCISKHNIKELFIRARVEHLQVTVKEYNIKLHYVMSHNNPADHLTKITKVGPHDKAWLEGPGLLRTQEHWKEFTKPIGRKDTIPIFQGKCVLPSALEIRNASASLSPFAEPFTPAKPSNQLNLGINIDIYEDLDKLYDDTAKLTHKEANPNTLRSAKISWIKFVQNQHFADVIIFLRHLKGHLLKSYEGKMILRKERLDTPT